MHLDERVASAGGGTSSTTRVTVTIDVAASANGQRGHHVELPRSASQHSQFWGPRLVHKLGVPYERLVDLSCDTIKLQ